MRQRCENPHNVAFKNYGGKNIFVCDDWKDFCTFYDWSMSNGYDDSLTIDRKDNSKGYFPDNCRWVTMKDQENNRTNNHLICVNGEKMTISRASDISGIRSATLAWRIKNNWGESELFTPVNFNNKRIRKEQKRC